MDVQYAWLLGAVRDKQEESKLFLSLLISTGTHSPKEAVGKKKISCCRNDCQKVPDK